MIEEHLTTEEVAKLLHVHRNTVKRIGDRGEIPFIRVSARGDRRYPISGVKRFVARWGAAPARDWENMDE